MDDDSIINEDGTAYNGNHHAVAIAVAAIIIGAAIGGYELVCAAFRLVF